MFENYKCQGRLAAVDLLKIIAATMVILSHCMIKYVSNGVQNPLMNLLWLTQMPLFMFASGFVNISKEKLTTPKDYLYRILKNAIKLLIPFLSFALITCAIENKSPLVHLLNIFLNPETSLWFLWVLFAIHLIFDFGLFLSNKTKRKFSVFLPVFISLTISAAIVTIMFLTNNKLNFNILSIKLIAYYIPFYCFGYLFRLLIIHDLFNRRYIQIIFYCLLGLAFLTLIFECIFYDSIYMFDDANIKYVIVRIVGSVSSIVVFTYLSDLLININFVKRRSRFGAYSLQAYYLHIIFLKFLNYSSDIIVLQWLISIGTSILLLLMIILSLIVVYNIPFLHLILFGKSFSRYKFEKNVPDLLK